MPWMLQCSLPEVSAAARRGRAARSAVRNTLGVGDAARRERGRRRHDARGGRLALATRPGGAAEVQSRQSHVTWLAGHVSRESFSLSCAALSYNECKPWCHIGGFGRVTKRDYVQVASFMALLGSIPSQEPHN